MILTFVCMLIYPPHMFYNIIKEIRIEKGKFDIIMQKKTFVTLNVQRE